MKIEETLKQGAVTAGTGTFSSTLQVTGAATLTGGIADATNIPLGTTTGTQLGTAATQKLGLWAAPPVVQPSTTGTVTGFTAGASTATKVDSTYTGGLGSTAYTISDIVLALKQLGALKQ